MNGRLQKIYLFEFSTEYRVNMFVVSFLIIINDLILFLFIIYLVTYIFVNIIWHKNFNNEAEYQLTIDDL